jgi:phosphatidylserine decarboxylase
MIGAKSSRFIAAWQANKDVLAASPRTRHPGPTQSEKRAAGYAPQAHRRADPNATGQNDIPSPRRNLMIHSAGRKTGFGSIVLYGLPFNLAGQTKMAKPLHEWLETDVAQVRDKPMRWLSEQYFFRDPNRAVFSDSAYLFPPADGIILYAQNVAPYEPILDIKGKSYSLRSALRDDDFPPRCLVIGIFMTFYDVHINRIPYAGRLSYRELDSIDTYNHPMIDVEKNLLDEIAPYTRNAGYLFNNQRIINRIYSQDLAQHYYVLQVADYDVGCITPFNLKQNQPFAQNQRFSQIRYGSQVDLIIPLSDRFNYEPLLEPGMHVETGVDPLVKISEERNT